MAFDQRLTPRLYNYFGGHPTVAEKRIFGGICFMISGHMCCGIVGASLMARVGPDNYEQSLNQRNVREMGFTGKPLTGFVYVSPEEFERDADLEYSGSLCEAVTCSLPPKSLKPPSRQRPSE